MRGGKGKGGRGEERVTGKVGRGDERGRDLEKKEKSAPMPSTIKAVARMQNLADLPVTTLQCESKK